MAPRLGFTLRALRRLDPAACDSDARLVWKDGDRGIVGVVVRNGALYQLGSIGVRELRLLGLQMIAHADEQERCSEPFEVVLP